MVGLCSLDPPNIAQVKERGGYEWLGAGYDLETPTLDAISNGYTNGAVNSAAIDWTGDSISVTISTGDPRGAFAMTVRVMDDGTVLMHLPHPSDGMLHEPLHELHPGTYRIGSERRQAPDDDEEE